LEFGAGLAEDLVRAAGFDRISGEQRNARGQWHFERRLEFTVGVVQNLLRATA
jgi:hypothetical protein